MGFSNNLNPSLNANIAGSQGIMAGPQFNGFSNSINSNLLKNNQIIKTNFCFFLIQSQIFDFYPEKISFQNFEQKTFENVKITGSINKKIFIPNDFNYFLQFVKNSSEFIKLSNKNNLINQGILVDNNDKAYCMNIIEIFRTNANQVQMDCEKIFEHDGFLKVKTQVQNIKHLTDHNFKKIKLFFEKMLIEKY